MYIYCIILLYYIIYLQNNHKNKWIQKIKIFLLKNYLTKKISKKCDILIDIVYNILMMYSIIIF